MRILGISAFGHDSAAALAVDGHILAAAQEERFTRRRHDAAFPVHAIQFCLGEGGVRLSAIDHVVFYEKPFRKFERLLGTYGALANRSLRSFGMEIPMHLKDRLYLKRVLRNELRKVDPLFEETRLLFTEHHLSHAASAFYPSPFSEALVLTMDGVGEWATTSLAIGRGNGLEVAREINFPHSLGLLYSAFTYYTGFEVNSGEHEMMELASYGEPNYADLILERLMDVKPDGSFRLDLRYFGYCAGPYMTNARFHKLFGGPPRRPGEPLTQIHMDVAASVQLVVETVVRKLVKSAVADTGMTKLCLAGGVALNCFANGKILRDGHVDDIWIQPAAGDAGGALGAALACHHLLMNQPRILPVNARDGMAGSFLGPGYTQQEIESALRASGAVFDVLDEEALLEESTRTLLAGGALGWFQGRMEFGSRGLGGRSILGDPRSPTMQRDLNSKLKLRESFRPFSPAVLRERVADWFELDRDSPYMLLAADVAESHRRAMTTENPRLFGIDKLDVVRSDIPAVTHVDYSAQIQTVHRETHPRYHALLSRFEAATGCPVLVNTGFKLRGEPIVCTPQDAFRCFTESDIEGLAIGNCFLRKDRLALA
jgi:carbamoyltransferase